MHARGVESSAAQHACKRLQKHQNHRLKEQLNKTSHGVWFVCINKNWISIESQSIERQAVNSERDVFRIASLDLCALRDYVYSCFSAGPLYY